MESAPLLLASASPRRRELVTALGVTCSIVPSDVDEAGLARGLPPAAGAVRVALAKARACAVRGVVLAADTVVVVDGVVLGKPADRAEAAGMLARLRGRRHEVLTAVVVRRNGRECATVRTTVVRMRAWGPDEAAAYVASGAGLDKAGAYGIQDGDFRPVDAVEGCWCNVVGLPLWTTYRLLRWVGWDVPSDPATCFQRCAACPLATGEPDLDCPPGFGA